MGKIFISYRQTDSAYQIATLYRELIKVFGKESVLKDVCPIPQEANFETYLQKQVEECQVVLAVIGEKWLDIWDEQDQRKMEDPFVRIEISAALRKGIPVILVLVGGRIPKPEELPEDLVELSNLHSLDIRHYPYFSGDMDRLIREIQQVLEGEPDSHDQDVKVPIPSSFRFLREATHSCGGQSNTVREYLHQSTAMEFVLIPGGTFEMGSNEWEQSQPIHMVSLKPFLMGKYLVTQKVWQKVMGKNPSIFKDNNRPVDTVSWDDCKKFCEKTGFFLPSEAQWEYACRARARTKYYWGNFLNEDYVWWGANPTFSPSS